LRKNPLIALLQRVSHASVSVDRQVLGEIDAGSLAFVGVERNDAIAQVDRLLERVLNYRMFNDSAGKMNLSLRETGGGLLLVPQFTLAAETNSGNRPSFASAAPPDEGEKLFDYVVAQSRLKHAIVATGRFGADMKVSLINDGPVTFWLRVPPADR
jgi:D-aminoacyl-tRNA deacylase